MKILFLLHPIIAQLMRHNRPPNADGVIGNVEQIVVAYCSMPGRGTRLLLDGTLKGAHL